MFGVEEDRVAGRHARDEERVSSVFVVGVMGIFARVRVGDVCVQGKQGRG